MTYTFKNVDYDSETLKKMTRQQLCALENQILQHYGETEKCLAATKEKAMDRVVLLLQRLHLEQESGASVDVEQVVETPESECHPQKNEKNVEPKLTKAAKPRRIRRLTRNMATIYTKVPGAAPLPDQRPNHWARYPDSIRVLDAILTSGLESSKLVRWQRCGIMTMRRPTEEEFQAFKLENEDKVTI